MDGLIGWAGGKGKLPPVYVPVVECRVLAEMGFSLADQAEMDPWLRSGLLDLHYAEAMAQREAEYRARAGR